MIWECWRALWISAKQRAQPDEGGVMEGFSVFHFLIILTVVAFFFFGGRKFKFPPFRGGPPTHPLPVTSTVETSCASGKPKEPR